ncbi:unnamed protein product [Pleuronectes platessa]|uniref:Uncharacterized protein n=1 Tax=Pleuronectes platessa TaxID=8262 RepID=A0A9N7UF29_PLEPL|nr:unnamed protein product [Pleuronectes platessa]
MATKARWMGALDVPSYLCPSPSLPPLYPHPLPPFFVHKWCVHILGKKPNLPASELRPLALGFYPRSLKFAGGVRTIIPLGARIEGHVLSGISREQESNECEGPVDRGAFN